MRCWKCVLSDVGSMFKNFFYNRRDYEEDANVSGGEK